MTRLEWSPYKRPYSEGLDQGVLYLTDNVVVPWNGLISVEERHTGTVDTEHYYDGERHRITQDIGNYAASIEAFTYPSEFALYDGYDDVKAHQTRPSFGLSYRTHSSGGYQIHLVYNASVMPSSRSQMTVMDDPTPLTFNWDISTMATNIPGARPGSHLVANLDRARYPEAIKALEDIIYGTDLTDPRLPSPAKVIELFESFVIFRVTYNGDGTWTATGPDDMIQVVDGAYTITSPSAVWLNEDVHQISSY